MDKKIKNILKIFGIWYLTTTVLCAIFVLCTFILLSAFEAGLDTDILAEWFSILGYCLIIPLQMLISYTLIYFPTIISLYFLFKKFKEIKARIWLTALVFGINNALYMIVEHLITQQHNISIIVELIAVIFFIPTIIISVFFMPQTILQHKKSVIITNTLTCIVGLGFLVGSDFIIERIKTISERKFLKKYEIIINSIEEHKEKYGGYPYEVPDIKKIPQNIKDTYPYYEYELINEFKDYVLIVKIKDDVQYNYCSNAETEECQEGWHRYRYQKKVGKWTKSIVDND